MNKRRRAVELQAQGLSTAQIGEILDLAVHEVNHMLHQARKHDARVKARQSAEGAPT